MHRVFAVLCLWSTISSLGHSTAIAANITIDTVPVGNAGNVGEVQPQGTFGAVGYDYRIGTYEVTNAQYAAFLNAKAASDLYGLYNPSMASDERGGILRSGASGGYAYTVKPDMANKPVNYVSWYDALRFANWLNNGQGAGDYNSGSYTLPSYQPFIVTRNPGAKWFLPSENEWYKAAYYDPRSAATGGPTGDDHYWRYPTSSDLPPVRATANNVGDISNPGINIANYNLGADWNGLHGNVTTVGSAGDLSESYYGTSDQGGNVYEWNESIMREPYKGMRGGAWVELLAGMDAAFQNSGEGEYSYFGFRVATVPEPGTAALAIVAGLLLLVWNRRLI